MSNHSHQKRGEEGIGGGGDRGGEEEDRAEKLS